MPQGNDYGDLLPAWKITLINQRALRRGIPPEQLAEVQQEVVLAVLEYRHDPAKGGCEHTALNVLIDRQISMFQRSHARRLKLQDRYCAKNDITTEEKAVPDETHLVDLRLDVQECLARMPKLDQQVAAGLANDEVVTAMIKRLRITRYEFDRTVERIRKALKAAGLHAWVTL